MKTAVLLLNFGEPDQATPEKVIPFLERIFLANASLMGPGADPATVCGVGAPGVGAEHADGAALGATQPLGHLHDRGLAGAVGTENARDRALRCLPTHVVQCELAAVVVRHAVDDDRRNGSTHDRQV